MIRAILLLFLALLSTVSITLVFSRQQPVPPQMDILHLHDCQLPCWIGIVPGQSTIGNAKILIESAYSPPEYEYSADYSPYQDIDWHTITRRYDGIHLSVRFNDGESAANQTEDTTITQISISSGPANRLTLGDWYNMLGEPQALSITWGNHWAAPNALYYRQRVRLTLFNEFDTFAVNGPNISAGTLDIYDHMDKSFPSVWAIPWRTWGTSYKDELLALMLP